MKRLTTNGKKSNVSKTERKKSYDDSILAFLSMKLTPIVYRRFLLQIPNKIIPKMSNPLLLSDFLTSSYNTKNNSLKILALHGLYILMTEHNLEYPFFYGKLYSLLNVDLFQMKYKPRFFYLLDIFLQSSHLPSNLVAGFIKRLARLSLFTPQNDLCLIITFIHNLMIRHPVTQIMINNNNSKEILSDSYLIDEIDPSKSNALESSLWEIHSLTTHHHPDVAECALSLIDQRKNIGSNERDIDKFLEIDYSEMFDNDIEFIGNRKLEYNKNNNKRSKEIVGECPINFNMSINLFPTKKIQTSDNETMLFDYE